MLRFCDVCKRIIDERFMRTHSVCNLCHEERRTITKDKPIESSEASPEPAGEVESGPYLPGLGPGQGE